jgi:hypothetical protein
MSREPISAPAAASLAELEQWVREHRVTWETTLRRETAAGQDEPAARVLTLIGRYPGDQLPLGGDGCSLVHERLRSIALHVLEPVPEARYRLDPFDAAVHLRAEEGWTPEVELTVVVELAEHDASDAGQRLRVLARIESGLEQLGVQRKHWREP